MAKHMIVALAIITGSLIVPQSSSAQPPPTQGQDTQKGQKGGQTQGKQGKTDQNSAERSGSTADATSVTGCLQRGTGTGTYTITGGDGKRYDLRTTTSSVKLDDHVGHRVTVLGAQGSGATDGKNAGTTKSNQSTTEGQGRTTQDQSTASQSTGQSAGSLDVSSLTMVSTNCQ